MEALLILGGLLLIFAGLIWLISQAFSTSLLWGLGSLLPPLTLAFVFSHWRTARKALILSCLGVIPLIVGLSLLASRDAERLEAIFSLGWLPTQVQPDLAMGVRGKLNGRRFAPQQGEVINGVLTLREGQGFFARQEVTIRLRQPSEGALRVDVLPEDDAGALPEVEIAWLSHEQELPETRRLDRGYTLHLDLQPVAPNKLRGSFHLVLPPQYETSLTGVIELYTDRLRYLGGDVDRRHDSRDTVAYVIEDYLKRRHANRNVALHSMPPVTLPADELEVEVQAQVKGELQTFTLRLKKSEQGWYVIGDEYPQLATQDAEPIAPSDTVEAAAAKVPQSTLDRRLRFSMEQVLSNPGRYQQLLMRAHTERGGVAQGRFAGLDSEGNLIIRRVIRGPGEATYNLAPGEIVLLELIEP